MVSFGLAIGIYIVVCIGIIAVLVLGPNRDQRDSVLGKAFRCVSKIPTVVGLACCLVCSCCNIQKAEIKWNACEEKSFHRKNPALLCFYMALVWTIEGLYLWYVAPTLSLPHCVFGFAMVFIGEYYFIRAWLCDPGVITQKEIEEQEEEDDNESAQKQKQQDENEGDDSCCNAQATVATTTTAKEVTTTTTTTQSKKEKTKKTRKPIEVSSLTTAEELKQNSRYDFDGFMYACVAGNGYGDSSRGAECYTCHVPRPSRSKHCGMCGHCVRRFDHHCPWINNDVGEGSLRYFIYFVFWHVIACFKGGYDCTMDCLNFLDSKRVWQSYFINRQGQREYPTWSVVILYLLQNKIVIACVAMFAFLVGLMLLWFLYHHVSMMARNVTTNDEVKIDVIMDYVSLLHNYAVNREELGKMQSRGNVDPQLLTDRETRLKQSLANLENHPPSFMDPRAAARLRSEIFNMKLGGPGVTAKEHRSRRDAAAAAFKKEIYQTFSLGSRWANIKESMYPYGPRPKVRPANINVGVPASAIGHHNVPSVTPPASMVQPGRNTAAGGGKKGKR